MKKNIKDPTKENVDDPKNWQKEMLDNVHFLTQQMKKMAGEIEEIKTNQRGKR